MDVVAERRARGWSQVDLSTKAGVDVRTLRRIEKGEPVRSVMMERVANAFGTVRSAGGVDREHMERSLEIVRGAAFAGVYSVPILVPYALLFVPIFTGAAMVAGGRPELLVGWVGIAFAIMISLGIVFAVVATRFERSERLRIRPAADLLLEAIATGDLVSLESSAARNLRIVAGRDAFADACNSPGSRLVILEA